jgi:hypothetical protein
LQRLNALMTRADTICRCCEIFEDLEIVLRKNKNEPL